MVLRMLKCPLQMCGRGSFRREGDEEPPLPEPQQHPRLLLPARERPELAEATTSS